MLASMSSAFRWVALGLVVMCSSKPLKVRAGLPSARVPVYAFVVAAADLLAAATGSRSWFASSSRDVRLAQARSMCHRT